MLWNPAVHPWKGRLAVGAHVEQIVETLGMTAVCVIGWHWQCYRIILPRCWWTTTAMQVVLFCTPFIVITLFALPSCWCTLSGRHFACQQGTVLIRFFIAFVQACLAQQVACLTFKRLK